MRNTGLYHSRRATITKITTKRTALATALVVVLLAPLAMTAQADTIRLKNGSIIKGKVTSFADEQFVVLLDSGSGRSLSKAMIYIADVAKIDFDATTETGGETTTSPTNSTASSSTSSETVEPPRNTARDTQPVNPTLSNRGNSTNSRRETAGEEPPVEKPKETEKATTAGGEEAAGEAPRKPLANARVVNVDVSAKRDWTSSGVIVKRGDRIRITATGTVTLDADGQVSGPEGIEPATPDAQKFMTDKPTGALIAVISADNDDFIFIGRATEFVAKRDGLLFLSVNEGSPKDNGGSFKTVLEIQAARPGARQ